MAIAITVPRLGWSMEEGTFVGWLKKPGEAVKIGDLLFTLENEKASRDVESADSGILRLPPDAPQAGDVVKVGALLGYLDAENESADKQESGNRRQETEVGSDLTPDSCPLTPEFCLATAARASHAAISPRARRRATELGMDWSRLQGSGRTGRIVEADVVAAKMATPSSLPMSRQSSAFRRPPGSDPPPEPPKGGTLAGSWPVSSSEGNRELSTMRRLIAQRTAESFATVPHFYLRTEVDATALLQLRERLLPEIERTTGVRLTLTDLILRAQARALRECPFANAIWQDNHIAPLAVCDVGLVVGLPDGLMIPIVRSADSAELAALVKQRAALVEDARAGRPDSNALQGGATSLSNLGNTCVDEFSAVIPLPHSSILAVGRAAPRPFVVQDQLVIRPTLKLCLSVDHRVMDGGPAAEFLGRIVAALEKPEILT